jgi:hypothetical protein
MEGDVRWKLQDSVADAHVCGDRASVTREKIVIKFTVGRAEHEQQVCRKHGAIVMCYSSDPNSVG